MEVNQLAEIIIYNNEENIQEDITVMAEKDFSGDLKFFWRYHPDASGTRLVYSSDFNRHFDTLKQAKKDALKSIKPLTNGNYTLY